MRSLLVHAVPYPTSYDSMPRVALLHAQRDFAEALAAAVERINSAYEVDVLSQPESVHSRVHRVLTERYDLLQVDEMVRNGMLAVLEQRRRGTPLVNCIRGWADYTNAHGQHGWLKHRSIRCRGELVFQHADRALFVSSVCRETMRRHYSFGANRIVRRPFDTAQFSNAQPTCDENVRILTVTNLRYQQKAQGIMTILDGLQPLFDRDERLQYMIAGDGRAFEEVAEYVESYPHRDRVDLLGYRDDVPHLLATSDLFVYVSYLDSLSMAVLEAQAAGLPVVCGATAGVPEAVGTAGRICPPTPTGIEYAVDEVLSDPDQFSELAEASREKMNHYNERAAQQYLDVWTDLLD